MEGSDGSPPQSLCMIRAAELFPKSQMEKEDVHLTVPFQELAGESVKYLGRTDDGVLALSNYRIFLLKNSTNSETSVPLGLIESAQSRDLFHLVINCKDASTVKCSFETAEQCSEWQRRIQLSTGVPETLESLFAFSFCSWTCDSMVNGVNIQNGGGNGIENMPYSVCLVPDYSERLQRTSRCDDDFMREVERLGFDLNGAWRISHANEDFKLCPSYPQKILVPCCISDETLQNVANFRGSRRLPVVVWRHRKSGAVIARCSQPEVGWLGWRNHKDEQLLKALADACAFDRGEQLRRFSQKNASNHSSPSSPEGSHEDVALDEVRKILIVDARSYTSAVTNRARGGGCECIEYYPCAEIEFMNLGNIHVIRKSFHALRQLCASPPDVPNWLGLLEKTMWLQHLSGLLTASMTVCHAIEKKGRPVLVHCSDGWDRTPQIVATAQLCLDPYYRTVEGFRVLVEREWLKYGHKFSDRCGHGPGSDEVNERCPVFVQWLDLVHQIHRQFPCSFEFSLGYLIKLTQHSHSCLFGTFLCNTFKERIDNCVFERTFSVWPFLSGPMYRNPLYVPNKEKVLWPAHNVRDLYLWTEVYFGSLGNQNCIDFPSCHVDGFHHPLTSMTKTRSYGDLVTAGVTQNGISRRSSDPNMTVDPNLTICTNSENNSTADTQSERNDTPDIIANLIHDTTRKLEHLTFELNNHDGNDFKSVQANGEKFYDNDNKQSSIEDNNKQSIPQAELETDDKNQSSNELANNEVLITNTAFLSSQNSNCNPIDCEGKATSCEDSLIIEPASVPAAFWESASPTTRFLNNSSVNTKMQNGLVYNTNTSNQNEETAPSSKSVFTNPDLMYSVDLGDNSCNIIGVCNSELTNTEIEQNLWHGSVNTSTDTLVPVDVGLKKFLNSNSNITALDDVAKDVCTFPLCDEPDGKSVEVLEFSEDCKPTNNNVTINSGEDSNITPKMHSSGDRPILSHSSSNTSVSSTSFSTNNFGKNSNSNNTGDHSTTCDSENPTGSFHPVHSSSRTNHAMEESILILPEHEKLEISISGETVPNNFNIRNSQNTTVGKLPTATTHSPYSFTPYVSTAAQRRRRTSSSNSRRDGLYAKQVNGSTISRFSLPGVRSLPMTPPSLPERPQIPLSCPDGLAHALSEQNIRLQQIVHEHKLREDVLLREIHDMRMALLKKICPNCNNVPTVTDEQCSTLDNAENASICSWEAVEDRSGPSSCTSSSIQPNATSVLWVPDHAVSRCRSCQIEFWLGRRKHHCRSCGQIFCADCSEFWAPLPDEKLFNPVRLCGPCYHSVTSRMQVSHHLSSTLVATLTPTAATSEA